MGHQHKMNWIGSLVGMIAFAIGNVLMMVK